MKWRQEEDRGEGEVVVVEERKKRRREREGREKKGRREGGKELSPQLWKHKKENVKQQLYWFLKRLKYFLSSRSLVQPRGLTGQL